MYILGISCFYHDSSVALLKDGKIIAAAEEERFTRKKHDTGFPINAINFCLNYENIKIKDIDYIGFYEKPFLKFERILSQHLNNFPRSLRMFVKSMPNLINEKIRISKIIRKKLKYKKEILYIDHHLAHAASSYLVSPFKKSAILTIDGVGEWATTALGYGKENKIFIEEEIRFPHSLGLLYTAITTYLGFKANNDEYKVMGLAPYGKPIYFEKLKEKLIKLEKDGSYKLNMDYFAYNYKEQMFSEKFIEEFGTSRKKESDITQFHKDMAASLQKLYEHILFMILNYLYKKYKLKNLCISGGCGLNSVANGKILKNTSFENIYIQPASGDGGTSIGVVSYIYNSILNNKRNFVMDSAYLGPEYNDDEIKNFLNKEEIKYSKFPNEERLLDQVSKLIYNNNVIGWFQGRMEFGPRALGNRSILSNPCNPNMQDILNLKVKHREKFRPFAPVICEEDVNKYFDGDKKLQMPSYYMLMVYPIKEEKRKLIPAVTHVDGSGRLQVLNKKYNELYWRLIKQFGKLSKVPILINTSFNIRGEPIVCSPKEAYKCMMGTGIDYLVLGNYLIKRDDNPKHMWDSEKYAKD